MSPNEKWSIKKNRNKEFNTIESKFRSAEKIKPNKLLPIDSKEENDYVLRSIDEHISNIKIHRPVPSYASKMSVRELDARMKRAIKKHKETFTFGVPTSYSKLQSNIKSMIKNMEETVEIPKMGYSNEKQRRLYKHELLQESFQNKLGLVNKPTIEQLMIGDFIREKRQKSLINTQESKLILKENVSDGNLAFQKQDRILRNPPDLQLKRRYTWKSGQKNPNNPCEKHSLLKRKSRRKGRISKIRLKNPSIHKSKYILTLDWQQNRNRQMGLQGENYITEGKKDKNKSLSWTNDGF